MWKMDEMPRKTKNFIKYCIYIFLFKKELKSRRTQTQLDPTCPRSLHRAFVVPPSLSCSPSPREKKKKNLKHLRA